MASAIIFGTTSGGFVVAAGAAAHAALASRTLSGKQWDTSGRGGFIGSIRGGKPAAAPAAPAPAAEPAAPTPKASGGGGGGSAIQTGNVPIGGSTKGAALGSPFGRFRGHKPTKLPKGGPKAYDPSKSP